MARNQSFKAFAQQLEKHNRALALAFLEAVSDMRSVAQTRAVEAAIERQDIQAVFQALRLDENFWAPLDAQIEDAFRSGAIWQMGQLPKKTGPEGLALIIRFDQRNPRAEAWVRQAAAKRITEIKADQRVAVRETVELGVTMGRGVKRIARDLIGKNDGNQRKGGLVGLHSREAAAVMRMRAELADPATASAYFRRSARDRSFDRTVAKAVREGKTLTTEQIDRIAGRYADKLLMGRGKRIARTEAHHAFSAGRSEAVMQMVDSGQVPAAAVTLTWQSTPSKRTRDTHQAMNGQRIRYGEAFVSPSGARMLFPGDTSLGAPGTETINCRCGARAEIDFAKLAR